MSNNKKTPYGKFNKLAEEIASAVLSEAEKLEDEIGAKLAEAWQEGYDEGVAEGQKNGYAEGHADGMGEAEENFKKKEKVKFT